MVVTDYQYDALQDFKLRSTQICLLINVMAGKTEQNLWKMEWGDV